MLRDVSLNIFFSSTINDQLLNADEIVSTFETVSVKFVVCVETVEQEDTIPWVESQLKTPIGKYSF